jgi:hypothetical protein
MHSLVIKNLEKLNSISWLNIFEEQGILKESYNSSFDELESIPTLSEDFHILKNNLLLKN